MMRDRFIIILAVLLGGGSVLLLGAGGSVAFTHFGWTEQDLLLWDAALSFVFFVQHSGMVRKPFRAWLARSVDPIYHGALYSIVSGVVLTCVVLCWQRSGIVVWSVNGVLRLLFVAAMVFALVVFAWSALSIRSFDILGVAPLRARVSGKTYQPGAFEVRGPYRWVRHPLYLGVLLVLWSTTNVTADRLLFNILWSAWVVVATYLEERDLEREFGEKYRVYRQHVPMLLPYRRPWPASGTP